MCDRHLAGRFVLDRNGNVWRQPGWRKKKRRLSSAGRLNRLKRIRALHTPIARKMVLVGFRSRFWADVPDARIPGFHEGQNQLVGGAAQPVADGTIRQADLRRF